MINNSHITNSKSKKRRLFLFSFVSLFVIISIIFIARQWYYNLDGIPRTELIAEVSSPDGKYSILAYISDINATTSESVVCELKYNDGIKKNKTVYFQNNESNARIVWRSNTEVFINGHVLTMPDDVYDYRRANR